MRWQFRHRIVSSLHRISSGQAAGSTQRYITSAPLSPAYIASASALLTLYDAVQVPVHHVTPYPHVEGWLALGDAPFGTPFAAKYNGTWMSKADRLRIGATISAALDATLDDIKLASGAMPQ